ncbi:hypothetical protein DFP72DRAFT_827633 [Ephemerocybe angulata]|uniref:Protein kinase domain-containing protein n=1 Tax=Ephemerocybe angulata TaxID=980116 RepID=A0A8H6HCB0_9AGAR|nr:hypothetical protein DFP72DRAFT_827633 [Tulosesus angulatus]
MASASTSHPYNQANLSSGEVYWRDHYIWLKQSGYALKPRFNPDWVPSWTGKNIDPNDCEDSKPLGVCWAAAAECKRTGKYVVLKPINIQKSPGEVRVLNMLSKEPLKSQRENHTVPILAVLCPPDDELNTRILVMPLLRRFNDPPFETMGEALHFIDSFLTGLDFMHRSNIAHGSICTFNLMMDATDMYPDGFSATWHGMKKDWSGPVHNKYTRTEKPPKYYLIDFSRSTHFAQGNTHRECISVPDTTVPELFQFPYKYAIDPFAVDVYCAGNMLRQYFLDGFPSPMTHEGSGYHGFDFLRPLLSDMIQVDPRKRPKMPEVVFRFQEIEKGLDRSFLRERCRKVVNHACEEESKLDALRYHLHKLAYGVRGLSPIPSDNA